MKKPRSFRDGTDRSLLDVVGSVPEKTGDSGRAGQSHARQKE
jgi:hypothetical protein